MIFGNVFLTRCKIGLALALTPCLTNAELVNTIESSQKLLAETYVNLNEKLEICSTLKKRPVKIEDKWLKEQSLIAQKAIILELSKKATKRCAQLEESAYINAAFELAVYGERKALDEYLKLRSYDKPNSEIQAILDTLDHDQLKRISKLNQYQFPFDAISAFK
ncbi:hypothetical protein CW749_05505 [Vibrio sp. vnigr-6D03]|uniref:hypothetical protein n=1 Tax=Vibrio sp. vnigr-6D03 TaxID=2058088 RepID=UPI000C34199F|nr:hypothetical protein [Vibrio sp. vnigr-6D03]PKF80629.1 hypothetical protein CW749_05505 [Vibrio sp. vnigr-6D03]